MPLRRWKFRIRHILDAINTVQDYTTGMDYHAFRADQKTIDAVVRNFAVIGEAARHVPPDVQKTHPEIPWTRMRAMRNLLVHDYDRVDPEVLFETVRRDLPQVLAALEKLLHEQSPE